MGGETARRSSSLLVSDIDLWADSARPASSSGRVARPIPGLPRSSAARRRTGRTPRTADRARNPRRPPRLGSAPSAGSISVVGGTWSGPQAFVRPDLRPGSRSGCLGPMPAAPSGGRPGSVAVVTAGANTRAPATLPALAARPGPDARGGLRGTQLDCARAGDLSNEPMGRPDSAAVLPVVAAGFKESARACCRTSWASVVLSSPVAITPDPPDDRDQRCVPAQSRRHRG